MEASFGILAAAWIWQLGAQAESLCYLGLAEALLLVAWVDWDCSYIYDVLTLPLMAAGLASAAFFPAQARAWWDPSAGSLGMLLLMWALALAGKKFTGREALGGGDIKLMAAAGAWLGFQGALNALMIGALAGLPLMLLHQRLRGAAWRSPAPFGPGLCLGTAAGAWNLVSRGGWDPLGLL